MHNQKTHIKYLKEKYDPIEAIILHGSRASGHEQPHSDWDYIILVNHSITQKQFREKIHDDEIEFEVVSLPIADEDILKRLGSKLQYARIIYDKSAQGQALLDAASVVYKKGIPDERVSTERLISRKRYFESKILGMKDSLDNPPMFMKKLGGFFPDIVNVWFPIKEQSFSKNLYIAIPHIREKDTVFAEYIDHLCSYDTSPTEQIQIAEKMVKHLFGL